jgi:hypothetical protein
MTDSTYPLKRQYSFQESWEQGAYQDHSFGARISGLLDEVEMRK